MGGGEMGLFVRMCLLFFGGVFFKQSSEKMFSKPSGKKTKNKSGQTNSESSDHRLKNRTEDLNKKLRTIIKSIQNQCNT